MLSRSLVEASCLLLEAKILQKKGEVSGAAVNHLGGILKVLLDEGCTHWPKLEMNKEQVDLIWEDREVSYIYSFGPAIDEKDIERGRASIKEVLKVFDGDIYYGREVSKDVENLSECLDQVVELEFGAFMPLEYLEELRLTLKSFMTPQVLTSLNELLALMNKEPVMSQAYSIISLNSEFGHECRYALAYLERFKRERLDRTIELLEECLKGLKGLKK